MCGYARSVMALRAAAGAVADAAADAVAVADAVADADADAVAAADAASPIAWISRRATNYARQATETTSRPAPWVAAGTTTP